MSENFEGFSMKENEVVKAEDELSFEELVDLADKAVRELSLENWKEAYNKVMKLVVFAGAESKTIDSWQAGYVEWEERFKEDDAEEALEDLKSMLQGALASSERRGEVAA